MPPDVDPPTAGSMVYMKLAGEANTAWEEANINLNSTASAADGGYMKFKLRIGRKKDKTEKKTSRTYLADMRSLACWYPPGETLPVGTRVIAKFRVGFTVTK